MTNEATSRTQAVPMVWITPANTLSRRAAVTSIRARSAARRRGCTTGPIRPRSIAPSGPPSRPTAPRMLKGLERGKRELRQAKNPAHGERYFAMAELDRRSKPMIAFIDDHRGVHGASRSASLAERPLGLPRPFRQADSA